MIILPERLLRELLGATRRDLRPMTCTLLVTQNLLFQLGVSLNNFHISKKVYPTVAQELRLSQRAVARSVERTANDCWAAMLSRDLVLDYIGQPLTTKPAPSQMVIYLTFFLQYGLPYFDIMSYLTHAPFGSL